ncbi:MAG: hypothetical protein NW241_05720 [Bacteroidia bacterium]|nr:hypothetical protein [Bacteroidia bacterium]
MLRFRLTALAMLALALPSLTQAQQDDVRSRRLLLLGVETAGSVLSISPQWPDYERNSSFYLRTVPRAGVFVLRDWVVGASLGYNYIHSALDSSTSGDAWEWGLFMRYYAGFLDSALTFPMPYPRIRLYLRPFAELNYTRLQAFAPLQSSAGPRIRDPFGQQAFAAAAGLHMSLRGRLYVEAAYQLRVLLDTPQTSVQIGPRLGLEYWFLRPPK